MCLAKIGLMVALYQAYVENQGQWLCTTTQGIQGKRNFEFLSNGSRVIGPNIKRPQGGAIAALSGKCGAEVHCWHPRNVCAQFRSDRTSGTGDKLFTDKVKHRQLILQTLEANLSQSGWNMQDWTHAC